MDKQFFLDLAGNAAGLAEQAVPMVTGSIAEPVAGLAALYHAGAGGDDASGVVNAIREAMTYQPRTEAGEMYQQALSGAVERIVQSAPVRTWKQGVDIAGGYSPTAGAVLATVPTAIGVAAGTKPALKAGREVSFLANQMQTGLLENAMTPKSLHSQAGVINITSKPKRVMSETARKAYDLGVKHREMMEENPDLTLLDIAYRSNAEDNALSDAIYRQGYELSAAAYESGRRGAKPPVLSTGLRYGKAPESGFSMNKATGASEQGVSMAKVDGVDYEWNPVSDSKLVRKPSKYEGWLLDPDHFWGGDGEPLMIKPIEILSK